MPRAKRVRESPRARLVATIAATAGRKHAQLRQLLETACGAAGHPPFCRNGRGKVVRALELGLQRAVVAGALQAVRVLLSCGADPLMVCSGAGDESAVHGAARTSHPGVLAALLAALPAGACLDQPTLRPSGETPLHVAAEEGNAGALRALLAAGARCDVYTRDAGVTPLWAAARAGSLECVRALLESGACARGTCSHLLDDEEGDDAEFAQPPAVLLYEEPLHAAARWGGEPQLGTAMVRALLEAGAHPDPPLAVRMYEDVFERRDARVSEAALLRWPGSSPKPAAARGAASPPLLPGPAAALPRSRAHSGGSSLTALVLVVSGQAANRRPLHSTGSASTMTASVAGTSEGAGSPETQGLWGSPADAGSVHACASQHVAAGTDGIIDEEPPTPLFLAVAANNTESVRLLLAAGASASRRVTVGVEHSQSLTPLHAAVLTGNALIVRMLLGAGADTTARVELEAGDGCVMPTAGAPVGIPSPGTVGSGSMGVPGSAASWPATVAIPPCNMGGAGSMSGTPDAGRECECGTPVRLEAGDLPNLAGASPLQLAYRFGRRAAQTILQGYPE